MGNNFTELAGRFEPDDCADWKNIFIANHKSKDMSTQDKTESNDLWYHLLNEEHEPMTGDVAKCSACDCLVPLNFIEDHEKSICYMCTPMTDDDWNLVKTTQI